MKNIKSVHYKGYAFFPMGDDSDIVKLHWRLWWTFFSTNTRLNSYYHKGNVYFHRKCTSQTNLAQSILGLRTFKLKLRIKLYAKARYYRKQEKAVTTLWNIFLQNHWANISTKLAERERSKFKINLKYNFMHGERPLFWVTTPSLTSAHRKFLNFQIPLKRNSHSHGFIP